MIQERDYPILVAFLEREADMYQWVSEAKGEHRQDFVDRMFKTITETVPGEKLDYVHIQSISNMGLKESELVLTPSHWGCGKSGYFYLPPSPKGATSLHIVDGK